MQATLSGTTLRATLSRIFHGTGAFFAVVLMLAMAPALLGQAVTATLTGTVTDPKGAVLPSATVTIVDENTGSPRSTDTTKDGTFSVPNLIPSTYTVKVVAQGFSPKELTGIALHTGDSVRLPTFVLAIGATTDTVTVTSVAGQILSMENGQRTETLNYQDIQDIALQSRDTTELLKVLPGVVQTSNSGYNALGVTTGTSALGTGMGVNGVPFKGGMSLNMDGANVIDVGDDFASLATVNPEMTQEVQVQTTNFGADEANGPVVVNTTGRSGGEHYHGEAYFDARNDILNANDWADNHRTPISPKSGAYYYYPGVNFSGPVPHTNKKLFFFAGAEVLQQFAGNATALNFTEATPAMLRGDFSMDDPDNAVLCPGGFYNSSNTVGFNGASYNENGWCQNITKDNGNAFYTQAPDGTTIAGGGTPVVTSYPNGSGTITVTNSYGGKLPSQAVDPNMVAFSKVWPAWNSPYVIKTLQGIINNGGNNVHQPIQNHDNGWLGRARIDYNWNSTNQFYISYQQSYDHQLSGGCGVGLYAGCGGNIQFPGGGSITKTYSKILNGHYVHIFSPTLTNEALASWVWGNIPKVLANPTADYRSTLGASFGCYYCAVGQKFMPTFGGNGVGFPGVGAGDVWEPGNYYIVQKAIPTFADNLTKVWGRHTLKFGATTSNTDNYQGSQTGAGMQGQLNFTGNSSPGQSTPNFNFFARQTVLTGPGTGCSVCGGYGAVAGQNYGSNNPTVNFLMGNLSNYQETNIEPLTDLAFQSIGIYADDSLKVSKRLTVQVGFRFEHIGAWYDRQGTGLAVFYPQLVLPEFYAGKYAPGFHWHANDAGVPLSGKPDRFGFISPRVGLSYDIFGNSRTVVRGGWGAYRYQEATNAPQNALNTAQGATTFQGNTAITSQPNSTFLASQIGQLKAFAPKCDRECVQTSGQTGFDPHDYGIPLTYSYNFTIDQKLPWNMLLDVGYVGNRTTHIQDTFAGNGDGSGIGGYDNQNKTPLGAYGQTVGIGAGSQYVPNPLGDPFTHRLVCNPENLSGASCNIAINNSAAPPPGTANASQDMDFRPYGRGNACTTSNTQCQIYGTQSVTMLQHHAYQNYNALQVQVVKRAGPVTLNLSGTWSKSLGIETTFDPFHIASNNSYSNQARPWVFNTNYIYREPNFWHGNRFVGGAVNGWTISGITLWQEGFNTLPGISIQYDPQTLPSFTGNSVTEGGVTYTPGQLGMNPGNYPTGVGANTFFGTNAGISTNRPNVTCDPKSGLATYQLYRPCFTASPFGQSGGLGLPFVAGQAYFENDLAIYKTFTIHEQNKVQFRLTATNWLNHPTPQFGSGENTTEYYLYDYNTHALKVNDRCNQSNSANPQNPAFTPNGIATGSCNAGQPIPATNQYAVSGQKPADLFGQQHVKNGFGAYNQRILELNVKYTF